MSSDATFEIYHNGKFSVSSSGIVTYDGGEIHKLESQPESMLENLVDSLKLSLSEHRIWYNVWSLLHLIHALISFFFCVSNPCSNICNTFLKNVFF
ncbi:unnamed protein product, partial [Arabidopsis halleri]